MDVLELKITFLDISRFIYSLYMLNTLENMKSSISEKLAGIYNMRITFKMDLNKSNTQIMRAQVMKTFLDSRMDKSYKIGRI